jgi:SAM-dependent methyltransferase
MNCPVCDSGAVYTAFDRGQYIYKQCSSCGVLFVANALCAQEIYDHYSESYYEAVASGFEERSGYPSYMAAQDTLEKSFSQKLTLLRERMPSGRLLDAGTAYGTFLRLASPHYECIGLDVSAYAASVALREFGMHVMVGSVAQAPFAAETFDAIVMWDIIEHLLNPVDALAEVYRMLKPGGITLVSTDDVSNWLPKLLGSRWWSLAPPLHLCHFSKRGMEIAFERAGVFEVLGFVKDKRSYSIPEIIEHFGVTYRSNLLARLALGLKRTPLGVLVLDIARPEQYVAIARKRAAV